MTFEEVNDLRRSIRDFSDKPVANELINALLEEALKAPSSSNTQPFKVVVAAGDVRKKIGEQLVKKFHQASQLKKMVLPKRIYRAYKDDLIVNRKFTPMLGKYPEPFQTRRVKTGVGLYDVLGIAREDKTARNEQLARNFDFFDAPVAIWVFVEPGMEFMAQVDAGLFMQNLMLAATSKGLGTCAQGALGMWRGPIDEYFDVPAKYELLCGMSLGYPSEHEVNAYKPEKINLLELMIPAKQNKSG